MKKSIKIVLAILFFVIITFPLYTYKVAEDKYAVIYRFGKVIKVDEETGLKFKVPFLDRKTYIKNNNQIYDLSPSEVLSKDKKTMIVDSYIIWRVADPLTFVQNTNTDTESVNYRLDNITYNAIKNNISRVEQSLAIERNEKLYNDMLEDVSSSLKTYGIEVVDLEIKQLDLPEENKFAVYSRMISERDKISATYTAEGKEEAEKIRNSTDKETAIIIANAEATAQSMIAEGENEYMKILTEAYDTTSESDFYKFIRNLDALKVSLKGDKTVILPIDSELTKIIIEQ